MEKDEAMSSSPNTVRDSTVIFKGKILSLREDEVMTEDGRIAKREIVEHTPSAVIVPYFEKTDEILLIEQYRDAVRATLLELPAGMIRHGEPPEHAAQRELGEETGYEAGVLTLLGESFTSPGFTDERHHFFLATRLKRVSDIQDTDEVASITRVKRADLLARIRGGQIQDGKTILGYFWAADHLARGKKR